MDKLTKKQKREIVRMVSISILAQQPPLFDDCNISEEDAIELDEGVASYLCSKVKADEPAFFNIPKTVIDYVRRHF